jgi:hypothetical protein
VLIQVTCSWGHSGGGAPPVSGIDWAADVCILLSLGAHGSYAAIGITASVYYFTC